MDGGSELGGRLRRAVVLGVAMVVAVGVDVAGAMGASSVDGVTILIGNPT